MADNYSFLGRGDTRTSLKDIVDLQKRIDEYRAKFKHNDLTPFTWHFSGGKIQGWTGGIIAGPTLVPSGEITSPSVFINASVYKYFSMKINLVESTASECTLKWYDTSGTLLGSKALSIPVNKVTSTTCDSYATITAPQLYIGLPNQTFVRSDIFIDADLTDIPEWTGTIGKISISYIKGNIAYVKIDKIDPMYTDKNLDVDSFNNMVSNVERLAGVPSGAIKDMSAIKAADDKPVNKKQILSLYDIFNRASTTAYNGCATCDVNTKTCAGSYGVITCQTCDGCNQYSACSCDQTCYTQTTTCTCNGTCYQDETYTCLQGDQQGCPIQDCGTPYGCSVVGYNSCPVYTTCACDGSGYIPCTTYNPNTDCTTCFGAGYTFCSFCYGPSYDSSGCPQFSDQACPMYTEPEQPCTTYGTCGNCNAVGYVPPTPTCPQHTNTCATCNTHTNPGTSFADCGTAFAQAFMGWSGCSVAGFGTIMALCPTHVITWGVDKPIVFDENGNQIEDPIIRPMACGCDGQPCYNFTACTCDEKMYNVTTCSCDKTCYGYHACATCNSCNGYVTCSSCDTSCYQDVCRDCHNMNYHVTPPQPYIGLPYTGLPDIGLPYKNL